jgi:hypothetical protein
MATVVASVGLALVVLLNVVATVLIARSDFETPLQKVLQLVFAWVVPCVGSIIVIAFLNDAGFKPKRRFESASSDKVWLPGIGPGSEGTSGHHGSHGEGSDAGHGGDAGFGGH